MIQKLLLPSQLILLTMFLLLSPTLSQAATKTWVGGTGTDKDWTLGSNWSDGTVPGATDDILFNVGNITFSTLPVNVAYQSISVTQGIIYLYNNAPTTLTIGGNVNYFPTGGVAGTDIYIVAGRGLSLESNVNITLASNSTALIYGQLIIKSGCTYNTNLSGAITTVIGESGSSYKGFIINYGTLNCTTPGNLLFNNYSTYSYIDIIQGTLPLATWHATSTCYIQITGGLAQYQQPFTEAAKNGFNQVFGNFIWEVNQYFCSVNLASYLKTVQGNLEIKQTGSSETGHNNTLILTNSPSDVLTIGGNFKVGGYVILNGGTITAGNTSISRNWQYKSAYLSVSSNTTLTVASLTVGPHKDYGFESSSFNPFPNFNISGGTVTINGDLYIYPSSYYSSSNSASSGIKGNITNNGSFSNTSGIVTLNGPASQSISSTNTTPTTFNKLTINNSNGLTISTNVMVRDVLEFINGKITTSSDKAIILENTPTASIVGADETKYINGNLQINMPAGTLAKTFPIGDATRYTPVALTFSGSGTTQAGNITARTNTGDNPNISSSNIQPVKSVNRYWTLTNSGVKFGTYNATFNFNPGDVDVFVPPTDPSIFIVQRYVPTTWYSTAVGTRTATSIQITGGTQTQFGSFQVGEPYCNIPTVFIVSGGGSYCEGTTPTPTFAVNLSGSEAGVKYQLKLNGNNTGDSITGTGSGFSFGNFSSAGTYTVVARRFAGGCYIVMSGTANITIISAPSLTASNNGPVCSGYPLTLSATDVEGATYSWVGPNSYASTEQNPTVSTNATEAMAGAYTVTITTGANCSVDKTTTVTINSSPAQPVSTVATEITYSSFKANWNATSGATGYRIDVSPDLSFLTFLDGLNNFDVSLVTDKLITGLLPGVNNYGYRVRAYNANCTGPDSYVIVISLPAIYRSQASGNWNSKDTWQLSYDGGNTWEPATYPPSASDLQISIQSGHTVTITSALTVDQVTVEAGGTLVHNAGVNLNISDGPGTDDLLVNGKFISKTTINNDGHIYFGAGSLYQHLRGGVKKSMMSFSEIPLATWANTSTCEILSVLGTPSGGLGQSFGNLTWKPTGTFNLGGLLTTVTGNFIVDIPSGSELQLASTQTGTLSVGGNMTVSGGRLTLSSGSGVTTIAVAGNTLVQNGATLDMGAGLITGNGNFILDNGTNLHVGSSEGISTSGLTGNIQVDGTRTYGVSNYKYNGTVSQVAGNGLPTIVNNLIIDNIAGVTLSGNVSCNDALDISTGKLIVPSSYNVTVGGPTTLGTAECLVLKSDASGTASFIDNGIINGPGTARIERYLAKYDKVTDYKFHFLSSPVGDAQPIQPEFSDPPNMPLTDFYKWDEPSNQWINYRGATANIVNNDFGDDGKFVAGKGYLVAYPSNITKIFKGKPFSGDLYINCTNSDGGWNLLGNPYPSPIDWQNILDNRLDHLANMDDALYYYDNSAANYRYYVELTGGLSGGTNYIPSMQGFMVHATSNLGQVFLNNTLRHHDGQNNYYKKATTLTKNILNLNVIGTDYSDQARVCFYNQATANFDSKFDAYKLFSYNAKVPRLYSVTPDNTQLAINTLPLSAMYGTVPLGFKAGVAGTYTIHAEGIGSFPAGMYIRLEDKKTGIVQNLNDMPVYSFTYSAGEDANRFVLHFMDATAVDKPEKADNYAVVVDDGVINVSALQSVNGQVNIIDMAGRRVGMAKLVSGSPVRLDLQGHPGVYIVNIVTNQGVVNKKVVVR